jgi:RHS repeat-associated protein
VARENNSVDDMHARFYNPTVGRFLSVDPVLDMRVAMTNPQGWNRYAYVRNNPMRWTDPTGKVIGYDDEFRKRVKNDAVFRQAFEAWKKTKSGSEQWTKMSKDRNTVYKFSVGRIDAPTGFMKPNKRTEERCRLCSRRTRTKAANSTNLTST